MNSNIIETSGLGKRYGGTWALRECTLAIPAGHVAALAINPNTVLKAYKELETKGLTAGRPGQGTFIQATLSQVALPELAGLRKTLLGWLTTADAAGLDEDGIVALFTSALRDFYERRGGTGERRGTATGETEGVA